MTSQVLHPTSPRLLLKGDLLMHYNPRAASHTVLFYKARDLQDALTLINSTHPASVLHHQPSARTPAVKPLQYPISLSSHQNKACSVLRRRQRQRLLLITVIVNTIHAHHDSQQGSVLSYCRRNISSISAVHPTTLDSY